MRTGLARTCLLVLFFCLAGGQAFAQDNRPAQSSQAIELSGFGIEATVLTASDLASLPAVEMDVSFMTSKGKRSGRYRGPLVWSVLAAAGLDTSGHRDLLKHGFAVIGADGYEIVFSLGEIAPDFGNTQALIALDIDGEAVPAGEQPRLVVPGDTLGARNVRDIVRIELR